MVVAFLGKFITKLVLICGLQFRSKEFFLVDVSRIETLAWKLKKVILILSKKQL